MTLQLQNGENLPSCLHLSTTSDLAYRKLLLNRELHPARACVMSLLYCIMRLLLSVTLRDSFSSRRGHQRSCLRGTLRLTLACFRGRCMAVILSRLRQLPAFWDAQQRSKWEPATKQMIQTGHPDVGPLDDLEVPGLFTCRSQSQQLISIHQHV